MHFGSSEGKKGERNGIDVPSVNRVGTASTPVGGALDIVERKSQIAGGMCILSTPPLTVY